MKPKRPFDVLSDSFVTEGGREILKHSKDSADIVMKEVFYDDALATINFILEMADCVMGIDIAMALDAMMQSADDADERDEIEHLAKRLAAIMAIAFNIKVRYQTHIEIETGKSASELDNTMQVEKLANDVKTTNAEDLDVEDLLGLALGGLPKDVLKRFRDSMRDNLDDGEMDDE